MNTTNDKRRNVLIQSRSRFIITKKLKNEILKRLYLCREDDLFIRIIYLDSRKKGFLDIFSTLKQFSFVLFTVGVYPVSNFSIF